MIACAAFNLSKTPDLIWLEEWGIWTPTEPINAFKYIRFLSLNVLPLCTRNVCSVRSYHLVWVLFDNFILFIVLENKNLRFEYSLISNRDSHERRSGRSRDENEKKAENERKAQIQMTAYVTNLFGDDSGRPVRRKENGRAKKRMCGLCGHRFLLKRWILAVCDFLFYTPFAFVFSSFGVRSQKILLNSIRWEFCGIMRSEEPLCHSRVIYDLMKHKTSVKKCVVVANVGRQIENW